MFLEDDTKKEGRDGDLKAGGQSWNIRQINEINTSCVMLAHTPIFGLCFMTVCLMKSNC